ncbi:reverse transcriptase domain-containing protein [Tanacetum coccineum]
MNPRWAADYVVIPTPGSAIIIPETANEFAIKGNHLTLIKGNQFDGRTKTNPHKNIHEFLGIYDMLKYRDTENEAVRLMMFPLSLTREAKTWMDELNEGTIETWDELRTAFISRFFPPALFDRLLGEIHAFSQHENEYLTDAWLRMKEILRNCHGHNLSNGNIIKIFYHGLNDITQEVLNAPAGGNSNSDTNKIMARMDAMTMKMDAQFADKQSDRPSGSLPSNTQPNPKGNSSKPYQPLQARNEHLNAISTRSGKSYDLPVNPNDQQNDFETLINFDSNDEDDETTPQPKPKNPKPIRAVQINVPLFGVLAGMLNYRKFLKEIVNSKHKIEQISAAFLSDESSAILQNKVPPKLGNPRSFLILCNFKKAFSCNALADLGASINLMSYSLYEKLSLETLKPTKMSVRLVDRSFQYPVGIAENMLVEVGKFTFPTDFIILKMKEDSKVLLILRRPFLHTINAVIRVKQKQLNLGVRTERMIFNIESAIKYSYSIDDTCLSINVIDEILEEDFDALLDEGSEILHSIEGTILEEKLFAKFDEFMAMTADESKYESDTEEPPFEKITFNTDYKIKTSLEEPPTDLELKPLTDNLEYVFLEEPFFLPVIISSQLYEEDKNKLAFVLKKHKRAFAWKTTDILGILFVDDFSVFGSSFDHCLNNLNKMLQHCEDAHLVLNWEKCHFMIKEGIMLGHKVSEAGLEVDKAKINVISKLPPPTYQRY